MRADSFASLTTWLLANGAQMDGVRVSWLGNARGAGLVAATDFAAGAVACSIPRSLLLCRRSGMDDPELGPLLRELEDDLQSESNGYDESTGCIALQLLHAATAVQRGDEQVRLAPYLASLPTTVESSLLWPRAQRDALLAGTSHLADVRELRAAALTEYRRVRRRIAQFEPAWLSDLGLDARSGPCPLSGEASSGSERWLLATGLVRSRAYLVSGGDEAGEEEADDDADADDDEDEDEDDDDDEDEDDDELVLSPLIDLANHDDRLQQSAVVWGRGGAEPADARHHLTLVCGMPVAEGEPLPSTYASPQPFPQPSPQSCFHSPLHGPCPPLSPSPPCHVAGTGSTRRARACSPLASPPPTSKRASRCGWQSTPRIPSPRRSAPSCRAPARSPSRTFCFMAAARSPRAARRAAARPPRAALPRS